MALLVIFEREIKSCGYVHLCFGPHAPAVTLDDALHHRETDVGPRRDFFGMQALEYSEGILGLRP